MNKDETTWLDDEDLPSADFWASEIEQAQINGDSIIAILEEALSNTYEAGKIAGKKETGVYEKFLEQFERE